MTRSLPVLFAEGFSIERSLAAGVIGGGAALTIGVIGQLVRTPPPPAEGQPAPKKLHPLAAVGLIALGLAITAAGVMWRVSL